MADHGLADRTDDAASVFEASPVRNGFLAPSLLTAMRELGASDEMLAVITAADRRPRRIRIDGPEGDT
jgi:hypothetical protein